jgi:hypothetical protein
LNNLATASGKDTVHILKALHKQVLDKLDALRPTLKEGTREIKTNYTPKYGETERLLLYLPFTGKSGMRSHPGTDVAPGSFKRDGA